MAAVAAVSTCAIAAPAAHAAWCGTDAVAADRQPDALTSWQVHVVYTIPSDGADRFVSFAPRIAADIADIDRWWRGQDAARTIRFDLDAFPGCPSDEGRLDISFVRLPREGAYYQPYDGRADRIASDLVGAGVNDMFKKYLVYYDGPTGAEDVCGEAPTGNPFGRTYAMVYLVHDRCGDLGTAGYEAIVAVHELLHSFGALPYPFPTPGPKNPCPDLSHPCDSGNDVLWSGGYCCLFDRVLDYGHDDYYGHGGSWLDVRNSPFLRHLDAPQYPLTVTLAGHADGAIVYSEPRGTSCPSACSANWDDGSELTLNATSNGSSDFVRWTGDCQGTDVVCHIKMTKATSVTAVFGPPHADLALRVRGHGRIDVVGARECSRSCTLSIVAGTTVHLRAIAARGSRFVGWSGACHGRAACAVRLPQDGADVAARFAP